MSTYATSNRGGLLRRFSRGQTMVLAAIAITVLLGFCALAVDVGLLWTEQHQMQDAADSAAIAGIRELQGGYTSSITSSARNDAKLNGFNYQSAGVTVTVNNPPLSGTYSGNVNAVEVIISQAEPTYFLSTLGTSTVTVSARAVGHLGSGAGCAFALDSTANDAFDVTGGATVSAPQCSIIVNSNACDALNSSNGATISANSIGVVGQYQGTGFTPTPTTGIGAVSDPLAYLQAPTVGSCNFTSTSIGNGATKTLNPGVYCGGISIGGGSTVTFTAGMYILYGGGLTISNGANVHGTGVTFYNTKGGSYTFQPVNINGGTSTTLSAPTSGSYEGILFFQDRSVPSSYVNSISNGTGTIFNGALYFPTTPLNYSGGSSSALYTILVADTINVSNGASVYLNANYSSNADGSPVKVPLLGE